MKVKVILIRTNF